MATTVTSGQLGLASPLGYLLDGTDEEMWAELQDYVTLGVEFIRIDFTWELVQPNSSAWNWTLIDKVVDAADSLGLEVIGLLDDTPSWTNQYLATSSSQQAFADFAYAAAEHFGDRVDYWEIYNEPNMKGITPEDYTATLKLAYEAIKSVDSDDFVISAGTAAVPYNANGFWGAPEYLEAMYASGAAGYMDAVGFHPYTWPLMPSDPASWNGWTLMEEDLREIMVANGDADLQIWMTEFGAPTQGSSSAMTEAEVSAMMTEAVALAQSYTWAGPILYYAYQDAGTNSNDTEHWFGLVEADGTRKSTYYTFQTLATADNATASASSDSPVVYSFDSYPGVVISDFNDGDTIDLSALDADTTTAGLQTFNFIGSAWLSEPGDLGVYVNTSQNLTYIQGKVNDSSTGKFSIVLEGVHDLDEDDFILSSSTKIYSYSSYPSGVISDFNDGDKIDLSALDADTTTTGSQSFDFVGSAWLADVGDLGVYVNTTQNRTYVQGKVGDGSGSTFSLILEGVHELDEDDFILSGTYKVYSFTSYPVGVISDFNAGDKIDLSALDADTTTSGNQSFNFVGSDWLNGAGDLGVYVNSSQDRTYIQGDLNGDAVVDFSLIVEGAHTFDADDFIL